MSIIRLLSEVVSNRIAAGEVIERPASVVKELIENAIDAGADRIRVKIEKAGEKLIAVVDNGSGMDADDALLCIEQHATSKIVSEKDLQVINSYGFRGEALPSIASVSRFFLKTRQRNQEAGFEIEMMAGKLLRTGPVGCAVGTEIIVRDLFCNVPARRKFLKSEGTEEKHIFEVVLNMALPNPQISFELSFDGRTVLQSPASTELIPRLQDFYGKEMIGNFLSVDQTIENLHITGFIAKHGVVRNSRKEQRFFVNRRAIESNITYYGVRDGYGSLVEKGGYPPVLLFIEMDPGLLDVNVHPAKREVRFRNERAVLHAIEETIASTLRSAANPTSALQTSFSLHSFLSGAEVSYQPTNGLTSELIFPEESSSDNRVILQSSGDSNSDLLRIPQSSEISSTGTSDSDSDSDLLRIPQRRELPHSENAQTLSLCFLGFLDKTYILASFEDGLVIIDQHAAHERVLFEKLLKSVKRAQSAPIESQQLLFPTPLELNRIESLFLRRYIDLFSSLGFDISEIGQTSILLNAIPHHLPEQNLSSFFHTTLSLLLEEQGQSKNRINLDVIARAACIAAVKAHDTLSQEEAEGLIRQMAQCEMPFSCPHGRPTLINISYKELEKRFGRRK